MRPASFKNALLLICLIVGPIIIIFAMSTRWMWLWPVPDVHDVVLMSQAKYYPQSDFQYRDYTTIHHFPPVTTTIPSDSRVLIELRPIRSTAISRYMRNFDGPDPNIVAENGKLKIYTNLTPASDNEPAWILDLTNLTRVIAAGKSLRYEARFDEGLPHAGAVMVKDVVVNPFPQPSTGIVEAIYLSPLPHEIITSRDEIFRLIYIGIILTIIGAFYFYHPAEGFLNWKKNFQREEPFTFTDI